MGLSCTRPGRHGSGLIVRSTCALYVDTGYLLASAAKRVTGTSLRSGIHVDYPSLIASLIDIAEARSGLPVLRVHWYDSARHGVPDAQQERIGELSKVKLRLGRFGVNGEQKGVDLRIGLDLVAHARNDASDVFFLVSGDDDLTEAVEEAQAHGVQVVLLAVPTTAGAPHAVSRHLLRAADELDTIDGAAVDAAVTKIERRSPPAPAIPALTAPNSRPSRALPTPLDIVTSSGRSTSVPRPAPSPHAAVPAYSGSTGQPSWIAPSYEEQTGQDDLIEKVVVNVLDSVLNSNTPDDVRELERARPSIPPDIDRALLRDASDALGVDDLDANIRHRLRACFWRKYDGSPSA